MKATEPQQGHDEIDSDVSALSATKQALLKIKQLKQELAQARLGQDQNIAVVSISCRFPRSSSDPESFWRCLMDQTNEISEIPGDRWAL